MIWKQLEPRYPLADAIGFIPDFLSDLDPRGACDQFKEKYCGGWLDAKVGPGGFTASADFLQLRYPGDPPLRALAETTLHSSAFVSTAPPERIIVYESAFVAVIQDGSFRVSRLD